MLTYLIAFLISLGLATALIPVIKAMARRYRLYDRNLSSRNIHTAPIPRLGGIAIAAGFYAPLLGLLIHTNLISDKVYQDPQKIWALLGGGLAIFALGLYDDLRGTGARLKFAVQLAVAVGIYYAGFRIEQIALPFEGRLPLGLLALPFTVIWIVGVINAFNLIDGLDGLAGGVAFFAVATTFLLGAVRDDTLMSLYMSAMGGGILGFLIFNFNPASIFMGDSGSMFLGFILAVTSLQTSQKSGTAVAILIPVVSLGLPIMDTLLAMVRRFLAGRSMFRADREHIHHKLLSLGFTQRRAVILLYALCMFLGAVALAMTFANSKEVTLLLLVVAAVVAVLIRKLGYHRGNGRLSGGAELRERNLRLRARVRAVGETLRQSSGREQIWGCLQSIAPELGVRSLKLELSDELADGSAQRNTYSWEKTDPAQGLAHQLRLPLGTEARGWLSVGLTPIDGMANEIDRDQEIAIEILCEYLTAAFERTERAGRGRTVVAIR